ncbi:MAG: hypothetical protein Q7U04_15895 [Bacteriovorax sp.]|nr:hypothetical protein [Bacteriovorax sp.]
MALKNSLLIFLTFGACIWTFNTNAKIILPELLAKQAINNIRFLTNDGKFTYYQKRSGSLLFSTNYKVKEILKGEIGTSYTIFSSSSRKKLVILQNEHFNNFLSLRAKEKIFLTNFDESEPREIGMGISPRLLLGDSWLSFYDPYSKILSFEHTTNAALKFSIKLNNRLNPYFIPQVIMTDENTVYYTDLNEEGIYGILEFKRNTTKSEVIYKAKSSMVKLEICLSQNQFILGEFGINFSNSGSIISKTDLPLKDFSKRENIYTSELNDLGHLICDFEPKNLVFIRNFGNSNIPSFDIANINTIDKKLTTLSEIKTVNNIINMDGILLTQEKGKYYIVKGDVDYKNTDSLKASDK